MQIVFQPEELWRVKAKENEKKEKEKNENITEFLLFHFFVSFHIYCERSLEHHQDAKEKRNDNKTEIQLPLKENEVSSAKNVDFHTYN